MFLMFCRYENLKCFAYGNMKIWKFAKTRCICPNYLRVHSGLLWKCFLHDLAKIIILHYLHHHHHHTTTMSLCLILIILLMQFPIFGYMLNPLNIQLTKNSKDRSKNLYDFNKKTITLIIPAPSALLRNNDPQLSGQK